MTDIIKNYPEMESSKVVKYLKQNPKVEKENIEEFKKELKMLGSVNPIIIAQGKTNKSDILRRNLKDTYTILKVTHYSAFISKEKLKEEYKKLIFRKNNLGSKYRK